MNLTSLLLGLPFLPVRGVIAVADVIRQEADRQMYDPASIQRELEDLADARAAGEITEEEEAERQQELLDRMIGPATAGNVDAGDDADHEPDEGDESGG